MAEHNIDKNLIENNLRYRFEYLSKFLNFTETDIATLNKLGKLAEPLIPKIVDQIFQKLLDFTITKSYFSMRHFGYTGILPVNPSELTLQSEQMIFRRKSLTQYLKRILRQKVWNDSFLEYLSNVGKMHTNMAGSHSINIDYIHINALFGFVEIILIENIMPNEALDLNTKQTILVALKKFFTIQSDFFAMHYIRQTKLSTLIVTKTNSEATSRCCI